jgi:hypothetical protein
MVCSSLWRRMRSGPLVAFARRECAPQHGIEIAVNGGARVSGFDGVFLQARQHLLPVADRSPHHQVGRAGIRSSSPSKVLATTRAGSLAGRATPEKAEPGALATSTLPARMTCRQTGHAQRGVGAQLQRVQKLVVQALEQPVHRDQPAQRLEVEVLVAHDQVIAFDQRDAPGSAPDRRVRNRFRCRVRASASAMWAS